MTNKTDMDILRKGQGVEVVSSPSLRKRVHEVALAIAHDNA